MSHDYYNKNLKSKANALRSAGTKSEACLWKYALSRRQRLGYQFRRQRPIDQYIVDFVCLPLSLVIEVDGATHTFETTAANDQIRQKRLEELGFRVIRFSDEQVLSQINRVAIEIDAIIKEQEISAQSDWYNKSKPAMSPFGGG